MSERTKAWLLVVVCVVVTGLLVWIVAEGLREGAGAVCRAAIETDPSSFLSHLCEEAP